MAAAPRSRKSYRSKKPQFDTFQFDGSARCVVLVGSDSFLRSHHTAEVAQVLESVHGEIDRFEFDGDVDTAGDVLEELRAVGLLHAHKLVILDKADRFLVAQGAGDTSKAKGPSRARQLMEAYAKAPCEGATLLLRSETWRGGNLDKHMAVFRVGVKNEAHAADWCLKRSTKVHAVTVDREAADLLVRRVGLDLGRLDGELAKLATIVGESANITERDVREVVGASREEQGWAIKTAVVLDGPAGSLQTIREIFDLSRDRQDVPAFWAVTELLRSLYAASTLLKQGMASNEAERAAGIFDRSNERKTADRIMRLAKAIDPAEAASRLREVMQIQANLRRGIGDPRHALERVAVVLADRLRALSPC